MNEKFLDMIVPAAVADEAWSKVPAEVTVGQAILESAWGNSQLASLANNLFGIKSSSDWAGDTIQMYGKEFIQGKWYNSVLIKWRKYDNHLASVNDHSTFLHRPRYARAFKGGNTWKEFLTEIWKGGYATDPNYVKHVIRVVESRDILQRIARARDEYNRINKEAQPASEIKIPGK